MTHQQHTHMLLPHPVLLPSLLEACYPQCHAVQLASQDFLRAACSPVLWAHHCQQHQHHKQHHMQHLQQHRAYSSDDNIDGRIGADPEQVADLLEANIYHPSKAEREQLRQQSRSRLLTTRREALSLYREVLRYSNLFVWKDEHGRMWKDVIRASARQEFEAARREPDPELVNRMIVTGRDAVQRAVQGFLRQRGRIIDEESSKPQVPPMHE